MKNLQKRKKVVPMNKKLLDQHLSNSFKNYKDLNKKEVILSVRHLKQYFKFKSKNFKYNKAVHDFSLDIYKQEAVGLVGESGCGKTTTGRSIIKLYDPTSGDVYFKGVRVSAGLRWNLKEIKWNIIRGNNEKNVLKKELDDNTTQISRPFDEKIALLLQQQKQEIDLVKNGSESGELRPTINRLADEYQKEVKVLQTNYDKALVALKKETPEELYDDAKKRLDSKLLIDKEALKAKYNKSTNLEAEISTYQGQLAMEDSKIAGKVSTDPSAVKYMITEIQNKYAPKIAALQEEKNLKISAITLEYNSKVQVINDRVQKIVDFQKETISFAKFDNKNYEANYNHFKKLEAREKGFISLGDQIEALKVERQESILANVGPFEDAINKLKLELNDKINSGKLSADQIKELKLQNKKLVIEATKKRDEALKKYLDLYEPKIQKVKNSVKELKVKRDEEIQIAKQPFNTKIFELNVAKKDELEKNNSATDKLAKKIEIENKYEDLINEIKLEQARLVNDIKKRYEKDINELEGNFTLKSPLMNKMQMIFQDPIASLDPRMTVKEIIAEGLRIRGEKNESEINDRVYEVLKLVGLVPEHATRYPHEFSGGQRQRIGVARALIMEPELIIADEPISALDVSIQAQVINLLNDLREKLGLTILFIAHDLSVVKYFCDRIAVMYFGQMVELTTSDELFKNPLHPYTRSLLSAIPVPDPLFEKKRQRITYNPITEHDYSSEKPTLKEITPGHFVYCNSAELEKYKKILVK
jgi:ABC-type oligopeptide transport system ATPase subunit